MADRARQKTDKLLNNLEKRVKAVYANDPQLKKIVKEYERYMKKVDESTHDLYLKYQKANDEKEKAEFKNKYINEVEKLTLKNKHYRIIVKRFVRIMSDANQKALDIVNEEMPEIYLINYNQISTDCKRIGIKING